METSRDCLATSDPPTPWRGEDSCHRGAVPSLTRIFDATCAPPRAKHAFAEENSANRLALGDLRFLFAGDPP